MDIKKSMKFKSQFIYVVLIVFVLVLLIFGILLITNFMVTENIEKNIASKISHVQQISEIVKNKIINRLKDDCEILSINSAIIKEIKNKDSEAIYSGLKNNYKGFTDNNIQILDNENNILLKNGFFKNIKNKDVFIKNFGSKFSLIKYESNYFLVFTEDILDSIKVIGKISACASFNNFRHYKNPDSMQIIYLAENEIIYSSFDIRQDSINSFLNMHKPVIDAVHATKLPSDLIFSNLNGIEVFLKIVPFGYDLPVYMVISIPANTEFKWLYSLNLYLIINLSAFGAIVIILIVIVLKKGASIKRLPGSANVYNLTIKEIESEPKVIQKDLITVALVSKIIYSDRVYDEMLQSVIDSYKNIQEEMVELYEGKVKNNDNNKMIALFSGNKRILDNALNCAKDIMKIIKKESQITNCQVAMALNFQNTFNGRDEQTEAVSDKIKHAEEFSKVAKAGQILIPAEQVKKLEVDITSLTSKVWKFKNIKGEIRLVDMG